MTVYTALLLFFRFKEKSPKTVSLGSGPSKHTSDSEDDDEEDSGDESGGFYENIVGGRV